MTARLTGANKLALRMEDDDGNRAIVTIAGGHVFIDGVMWPAAILRFLASEATGRDAHGYIRSEHLMSECYWAECPDHACPYDHAHTSNWCGRPTCRRS